MRKRVSICLICLAFVALTFFSFIDVQVVEAQEKPVLKYGLSNPLSGPAVGWGLPGDRLQKMLADKINKEGGLKVGDKVYTVKGLSYDHKWIEAESVSVLKRAIADGCVFTIGLLGEENTRPLARVSNENRHIVVSCMAGSAAVTNAKNPYIFRAMASDDILMGIVAPKLYKKKGWKRIYIVTQDNTMGHSGTVSLKRGIKAQGLEGVLVGEDYLPSLSQDFTPALTRALAAKPDAIECGAWPPGPIATFVKQARELGFTGAILNSTGSCPYQAMENAVKNLTYLEEVYFLRTFPMGKEPTPGYKAVRDEYIRRFKEAPGPAPLETYAGAEFLFKAIEAVGTTDPDALVHFMRDFETETIYGHTRLIGKDNPLLPGYGINNNFDFRVPASTYSSKGKIVMVDY